MSKNRAPVSNRANALTDTSELKIEIDELVYQLYGLTENDVKIVEGRA